MQLRAGNVYALASDTGAKQGLGSNVFAGMSYLYSRTDGEYVGYPRDSRQGIRHSSQGWSINANSNCKEGAWEFLKFLLSENYQRQMEGGFSPLKEVYEEQLESYASPLTYDIYLPEAGGVVTITNSYNMHGLLFRKRQPHISPVRGALRMSC